MLQDNGSYGWLHLRSRFDDADPLMRAAVSNGQSATTAVWMLVEVISIVVRILVVCEFIFHIFVRIGLDFGRDGFVGRSLCSHGHQCESQPSRCNVPWIRGFLHASEPSSY